MQTYTKLYLSAWIICWTVLLAARPAACGVSEQPDLQVHSFAGVPCGITYEGDDLHIKAGYYINLRAVKYDNSNRRDSDLELIDARPVLEGTLRDFSWRIEADLEGTDTPRNMYELWAAWESCPAFRLRAGQFKVALGSEFATHEFDLPFQGHSYTAYLDGRYDAGVQAEGELAQGLLWYQASITAGKGFGLEGHRLTSPMYSLRLTAHPFARLNQGTSALAGFFIGAGYALLGDFDDPVIIATPLQSRIFKTRDLDGDSGTWLHLEAGYHHGPFLFGIEDIDGAANDVPIGGGDSEDIDQLTTWVAYAAWNITGEEQVWERGGWTTALPASGYGRWGRWELAGRYSNSDIDRNLFTYGLADPAVSTQECRSFSLALNWYPCVYARLSLGGVKTIADDEIAAFEGDKRDTSFFLSLQARF